MIGAGRLRNTVEVLRRVVTRAPNSERIVSYELLTRVAAEIKPANGQETVSGMAETEQQMFAIRLRYGRTAASLTSADRIRFRGRLFQITQPPINSEYRNEELIVMAREVVPDAEAQADE